MKALVLVDVQHDFLPGGSLAVPEGDEVIPVANRIQPAFGLVVATQDWHPAGHASFASSHRGKSPFEVIDLDGTPQVLWPDHCVQGSRGAELAEGLDTRRVEAIFRKGMAPRIDSYSGFFDNERKKSTGLGDYLKGKGVTAIALAGLATDVCVMHTALDARTLGFDTVLVEDGCRGVEVSPGDVARAIARMREVGVGVVGSGELA